MLVCPSCRETNPEGAIVCEHCGADMKARAALRGRRSTPPDIEIPPRKQSPRWVPMTVFALVVVGVAALAVWLGIRPQACDGKFSSSQFSYCLAVPRGWTASSATIGSVSVDQFAHGGTTTAVVMSVPLRSGATIETYAELARDQAMQKGVRPGPTQSIRLDGQPALEWTISAAGDVSFRGIEVVAVVDDTGWTVQLDDAVSTFGDDAAPFRSMLSSWHFR